MKAVLLPLAVGLLLFAAVSVRLRLRMPKEAARTLLGLYLMFLPVLILAHILTPSDLWFLGPELVVPNFAAELSFSIFLFSAGFFGGLLQLYNLADRGLSLRMLIDILESPDGAMTADEVADSYGGGRGIQWMYTKRIEGMAYAGLAEMRGDHLVLTTRGQKAARLFDWLQHLARIDVPRGT
jgi:hypothetical protein